jgi:hypothetical protein
MSDEKKTFTPRTLSSSSPHVAPSVAASSPSAGVTFSVVNLLESMSRADELQKEGETHEATGATQIDDAVTCYEEALQLDTGNAYLTFLLRRARNKAARFERAYEQHQVIITERSIRSLGAQHLPVRLAGGLMSIGKPTRIGER